MDKHFKVPKPPNFNKSNVHKNPMIAPSVNTVRLPQALDLEEVVIGALLMFKNAIQEVKGYLRPEMFYNDRHKIIYKAILALENKGNPIDLLTVSQELRRVQKLAEVGGDYYLISLTQRVSSDAHIDYHSRIIVQKYVLRTIIKVCDHMRAHCYHSDPDIFDMMDYNDKMMAKIKHDIDIDNAMNESAADELKRKMNRIMSGQASGVPMGHSEFDEWCGGFQERELIIIAARPGMGKTTIVISACYKISIEMKIPSAFFSLEMAYNSILQRLASKMIGIPFSKIREGKIDARQYHEITSAFNEIEKTPLHIISGEKFHYNIVQKIKELVTNRGVRIVFIDYVQLMKIGEKSSDETSELRIITRDLKALALQLNIPIVILSQLKRDIDARTNKRPMLSDLKMSGSLEEDADTIMFPYRDSYYKKDVKFAPKEQGRVELDIAKGRNIGTRNLDSYIDFETFSFISMNDYGI